MVDIYNSLVYLKGHRLIDYNKMGDTGSENFAGFKVTSNGVDIIEGIERTEEQKRQFNIIFNLKLADNISIDSLIKNEIGSIFKASVV